MLDTALATAGLSPADRGLCHELVCGVVRWQKSLDALIARKTDPAREQRPALKNLLRLGLYQIFWLTKIPPHAAVHETVELAKRSGHGPQAGFINAVLRGYLRETDEIRKILADMKTSQPALGWSHPEWLVEKWRKNFGEENMRALLAWNNTPPKTFARLNTLKIGKAADQGSDSVAVVSRPKDIAEMLGLWRNEGVDYEAFASDWTGENSVYELKAHPSFSRLVSLREGFFYLQDPSTLLAPTLLAPQPGETIWDMCAAPGGKTTFLAQLMGNHGKIIASDIEPNRLRLVKDNCARLGVTCVEIGPPAKFSISHFDRILIDAPCSNTGVMRRRVDLRWRISEAEVLRLQKSQIELLEEAAAKLKPGGGIVYSTCSLEPEENSGVVKQFLAAHNDFSLETERQLSPFANGVDGAYVAKLKSN